MRSGQEKKKEETYKRELDGEMGKEDLFRAFPLFRRGWDFGRLEFPPPEVRHGVDDDPRNASAKVDYLFVFLKKKKKEKQK